MTDINALIASAIPVMPPDDWFDNPGLQAPTAIRVTPEGRVFGHVASWNTSHIGMPNGVRPPRSRSGYAYFKTGEILTAGGQLLPVGQLTLAGGHAGLQATASEAIKHYDDTNSAIADVTVGEDQHGIWVAGALRPQATPDQVRALRASAPSGDWRMIEGRLEMVAVCQVNVPGFPIPRALAAGGQRYALVAAGSLPLLAQVVAEQDMEARLLKLESAEAEREFEQLSLVASATKQRVHELREASLKRAAELARLRVRDPKRYREVTALAASVSDAKREKAADNGHAMPDGSFPINTVSDLKNAVHSYGRAKNKTAAKKHIIKRARALNHAKLLPAEWLDSLSAAGNFDFLPDGFLSEKAKKQARDSNGRFLNGGSFVRWQDPHTGEYHFGQVLHGNEQPDGSLQVRLADTKNIVDKQPSDLEKIRAILPRNQVDRQNDRGVPFKRNQGHGEFRPGKDGLGGARPSSDPSIITAPSAGPVAASAAEASDQADAADDWASDPGYTAGPGFELGDPVASSEDGTPLGTVTDATDPNAIEVTDPNGLITVYMIDELDLASPEPDEDGEPADTDAEDEQVTPDQNDLEDELPSDEIGPSEDLL